MNRKSLLKHVVFLVFFIFITNFLANKFYLYSSIWYFDMIMHTLGGLWLGLAYMYIFPPKDDSLNAYIKIISFVLFIGVGWEVYEFIFYNVFAGSIFNHLDTISDVFFDLTGGTIATLYYFYKTMFVIKNEVQLD